MNRTLKQLLSGMQGVYIVGGSVRDMLLDLSPTDYDLAVPGDPAAFSEHLSRKISGRVVKLGKPGAPLFRVISSSMAIDVSPLKGSSIRQDLFKRDFTINAIAYDPARDTLIDPCGGRKDLSSGSVRMVSDTSFQDDPIRLLRAYRLAATLNFHIDEATRRVIRRQADLIRSSAGERIREELIRLLESPSSADHIDRMESSGLLYSIFPELSQLNRSFQSPSGRSDAWIRLLRGFRHLESFSNALVFQTPGWTDFANRCIRDALEFFQPALLKVAFLLHDTGKPTGRLQYKDNRDFRYPEKNARAAEKICRRLRFSNREIKSVAAVIYYHRAPFSLFRAYRSGSLTERKNVLFFMACKDMTPAVLMHSLAEFRKDGDPDAEEGFDAFVGILFDRFFGKFQPEKKAPPLLTGDDLIQNFGLASSSLIGLLLRKIEEARLSHEISTREHALALAEKILTEELDNHPPFQ